jgi:hypothetical protein
MQIPAFSDQCYDRGIGSNQGLDVPILIAGGVLVSCRAKGGDLGLFQPQLFDPREELGIFGIGAGPPSFDVLNAKIIESLRDL